MHVSVRQGNVQLEIDVLTWKRVLDFGEFPSAQFQTRYVHTFHMLTEIDVTTNEHTTLVNQVKCVYITK